MIQPGFIESKMTAKIQSNALVKRIAKKQMHDSVLLGREGKADEIGYTALFLASDESSYITGTDIVVDGGWVTAAPYLGNDRLHHSGWNASRWRFTVASSASVTRILAGYSRSSRRAYTSSPVLFVVAPIKLMIVSSETSGFPRQFIVMYENKRCSIRFHFEVPGGR